MEVPVNAVNWVEIPVADFARAKKFYSTIYNYEMPEMPMGPITMGILPYQQGNGVGAAICFGEGYEPTDKGAKVYLNGDPDLNTVLNRVEAAGGKVVLAKTDIGEDFGFFAVFHDTEGNWIGLHSMG